MSHLSTQNALSTTTNSNNSLPERRAGSAAARADGSTQVWTTATPDIPDDSFLDAIAFANLPEVGLNRWVAEINGTPFPDSELPDADGEDTVDSGSDSDERISPAAVTSVSTSTSPADEETLRASSAPVSQNSSTAIAANPSSRHNAAAPSNFTGSVIARTEAAALPVVVPAPRTHRPNAKIPTSAIPLLTRNRARTLANAAQAESTPTVQSLPAQRPAQRPAMAVTGRGSRSSSTRPTPISRSQESRSAFTPPAAVVPTAQSNSRAVSSSSSSLATARSAIASAPAVVATAQNSSRSVSSLSSSSSAAARSAIASAAAVVPAAQSSSRSMSSSSSSSSSEAARSAFTPPAGVVPAIPSSSNQLANSTQINGILPQLTVNPWSPEFLALVNWQPSGGSQLPPSFNDFVQFQTAVRLNAIQSAARMMLNLSSSSLPLSLALSAAIPNQAPRSQPLSTVLPQTESRVLPPSVSGMAVENPSRAVTRSIARSRGDSISATEVQPSNPRSSRRSLLTGRRERDGSGRFQPVERPSNSVREGSQSSDANQLDAQAPDHSSSSSRRGSKRKAERQAGR